MMLGAPRTRELVELRSGLEVQAAELAAERITNEALERMKGNLAAMGQVSMTWPPLLRLTRLSTAKLPKVRETRCFRSYCKVSVLFLGSGWIGHLPTKGTLQPH